MKLVWLYLSLFLLLLVALSGGSALVAAQTAATSVSPPADPERLTVQDEAEAFRTSLEAAQADLLRQLEANFAALEESLRAVQSKADNVRAEGQVLNHWRILVRELRIQGQKVLASQQAFVGSASTFAEKLSQGPAHFRTVATEFRTFADEESYSELATDYRHVASSFETLAVRCEIQLRRVKPAIEEYQSNLVYIERSLLFLTRFEQALSTVPDLAEFDRLEGSLTELSRYVQGFERLRGSLRSFDQRLHAPVEDSETRPSSAPTEPAPDAGKYRFAKSRR